MLTYYYFIHTVYPSYGLIVPSYISTRSSVGIGSIGLIRVALNRVRPVRR